MVLFAADTLVVGILIGLPCLVLVALYTILTNTVICAPNQVFVLVGRQQTLPDGSRIGYRLLKGGRTIRVPFVEELSSLDLTPLDLAHEGSYALEGGGRASFGFEAAVRISAEEPPLRRAVERFLGLGRDEIARVASEALAACLGEILAGHETSRRRGGCAGGLASELERVGRERLLALGLELTSFSLQRS